MTGRIEARLAELGHHVPTAPKPAANYVPWVRTGNLVYIAGQVPMRDGAFRWVGKVGQDWTIEQGQEAAREVALNMLSQLKAALDGDLDRNLRIDMGARPPLRNSAPSPSHPT